jgi:hypothetical protein
MRTLAFRAGMAVALSAGAVFGGYLALLLYTFRRYGLL